MGGCSVHATLVSTFICLIAWGVMAASAAWGGTITGTIRFAGATVEQKKLPVTVDQHVCGKEKEAEHLALSPDKGIRNVVVSLKPPPPGAKWETPLPPVQMDQKQCVFIPRVVVVPVDGTVEFLNSDRLLHNLHSRSRMENKFNRTHSKGRTIPIVFKKPEIFRLDCDLHPWMRAWVVVAPHPFYATTNDRGEFVLGGVPAGQYTLQVWHESLGTVTKEVSVEDRGITTLTVEMSQK